MHTSTGQIRTIANERAPGRPLAPWTYTNPEVFDLEYEAFFLRRWQLIGHVNDVVETGDYMTADIGRDNVIVIRGKDEKLRAFLNVCRHRGSRILEGAGSCRGVIRCPYHGWTYQLDGSLMAIPREENFENFDRGNYGLHEIELEVFHGLVFARVKSGGPSLAAHFADTASYFEKYGVADYVQIMETEFQIWDVNWKVAWDNYLENYHIPVGHPGLNRLIHTNGENGELTSGVSYGVFEMNDKPSNVDIERQYQEQLHFGNERLPEDIKGRWVQFGIAGSLGIDLYPEMVDFFQLIPLAVDKTLVRAMFYGHKNPTPEEIELRRLNRLINDPVNEEDRILCARVQKGLQTTGYRPGPLSRQERSVFNFHEMVRNLLPVTACDEPPAKGQIAVENYRLSA